jgi:acetyl esterase/lipase
MKHICSTFLLFLLGSTFAVAGDQIRPDQIIVYKALESSELNLHVFNPSGLVPADQRPAIVFFFGGGWNGGTPRQFYQQARDFAALGFVAISAEYRIKKTHQTTPFECVQDGKSAIRWIRQHANELGIDPNRVISAGGSAGGHVAACTGVIEGHEEAGEDMSVSSLPDLMVLYNPVIDTTEAGYGLKAVTEARKTEISPCHHVRAGLPPTLIFHGTTDSTVPFENVERFTALMTTAGNDCTLVAFEGKGHGFFNGSFFRPKNSDVDYDAMMTSCVEFLTKQGYLLIVSSGDDNG